MDDSPFGADALLGQVNVHSKAVFTYTMTMMDEIRWMGGRREGWDPNSLHACGSTLKKLGQKDKYKALNRRST